VLPSLVAAKFKMDNESAFQPGPLCVTLRSFCLPCCFRDPWGGWAENDVFRDDWCMFVDERTKTIPTNTAMYHGYDCSVLPRIREIQTAYPWNASC
jgi:hypothetical protein